jgi:hypothetical protein
MQTQFPYLSVSAEARPCDLLDGASGCEQNALLTFHCPVRIDSYKLWSANRVKCGTVLIAGAHYSRLISCGEKCRQNLQASTVSPDTS